MMQLKAIFSVILRDYEFELAQPSETYRDDCSKMVIQLEQPCRVRVPPRACHEGRSSTSTCARGTRCACSRHPRSSASTRTPTTSGPRASTPTSALRPRSTTPCSYCPAMALSRRGGVNDAQTREMEAFWERWLDANRDAEAGRDWGGLADFYAEDATYGWRHAPTSTSWPSAARRSARRPRHRDGGPRRLALRLPATVMDERTGMIVGFWKQRAGLTDDRRPRVRDRGHRRLAGSAGTPDGRSPGSATGSTSATSAHMFLEIAGSGKAPQGLLDRMSQNGMEQPGHYRHDDLPSTVWPPVVGVPMRVTDAIPAPRTAGRRQARRRRRAAATYRDPEPGHRRGDRASPDAAAGRHRRRDRRRPPGVRRDRLATTSRSGSAACASCATRWSTTATSCAR